MFKNVLFLLLALSPLGAAPTHGPEVVVNNRVLAEVGKRKISVVDVMKRLDMMIARQSPEALEVPSARFQFYTKEWRTMLGQMVDQELMLADAAALQIKVSEGDVHEALRERFGPNVMGNLERFGLSYEEAVDYLRTELLVQRMTWFRINMKALQNVGPGNVRTGYRDYCSLNPAKTQFRYRVLTVQAPSQEAATQLVEEARLQLASGSSEESITTTLSETGLRGFSPHLALTSIYDVDDKQISEQLRTQLAGMEPGELSQPVYNEARKHYRVLLLKERSFSEPPGFTTLSSKIEDQLIERAIAHESERYLKKLRSHYGVDEKALSERIPADFQPFALR